MSLVEWSVVVANIVIVLTGLGAAIAWIMAVWTWRHTVRETSERIDGQLREATDLLRRIWQDQALLARPSLRPPADPRHGLGPLDVGPPS